jgi:sulfur-carrier protein
MRVVVRLASVLRSHAAGARCVELDLAEPVTVRAVLDELDARLPAIGRRVRDESGALRTHVNVFVGPDNARDRGGVDCPVPRGAEVAVLPAVSGG